MNDQIKELLDFRLELTFLCHFLPSSNTDTNYHTAPCGADMPLQNKHDNSRAVVSRLLLRGTRTLTTLSAGKLPILRA
jgi:hypothetical protein